MPDSSSDIVTRCPQCSTAFRVTPNQLAVAGGVVRCGSCLVVFKAVDYKSSTTDTALDKPNVENSLEESKIDEDSLDDSLIIAEEESGLILNDDIYDLDTDNKNKNTSLFDRKLQPTSPPSREKADESWALDMLADLEDDDDIEPIKINRPKTTEETHQEKLNTSTDKILTEKTAVNSKQEFDPATVAATIKEELFQEELTQTITLKDNQHSIVEEKTKEKRGFSFFRRKKKKIDQTNSDDPNHEMANPEDERESDDLTFDFDETFDQNFSDNTIEVDNDNNGKAEKLSPSFIKQNGSNEVEALYFEEDIGEDLYEKDVNQKHEPIENDTYSEPSHQSSLTPHISDEEIEDAMHSRTSYASKHNDYLSGIQPAPVEMEWYGSERTQRWLWMSGATIFGAILLIQIATFRFDILSKNENYRPYYETACKLIGCQLPNLIDTNKIRATNLVVRSHPSQADSLIIDAILINNASFGQPYPALKLEFSDLNNQLLASRDLQPSEYLRGELSGATKMPGNQPIQLSLSIIDPGETAVNYQIRVIKATPQP